LTTAHRDIVTQKLSYLLTCSRTWPTSRRQGCTGGQCYPCVSVSPGYYLALLQQPQPPPTTLRCNRIYWSTLFTRRYRKNT